MLATTLDESIGRSYDKVSRLLELKWGDHGPGAALESFASQSDYESNAHESATTLPPSDTTLPEMPKPLPSRLAFSYASLHSAVERHIHAQGGIDQVDNESRRSLARAFQSAAIGQLEEKVVLALEWCNNNQISINDLVVSGGVASNMYLRSRYVRKDHTFLACSRFFQDFSSVCNDILHPRTQSACRVLLLRCVPVSEASTRCLSQSYKGYHR